MKEVVEEAFLNGDDSVTDELFRKSFLNVVPLSKTSPERIEDIRNWGKERAVPASGNPIGGSNEKTPMRRTVLLS